MDAETFKHFKYEMALGAAIPMPEPKIDYFPHSQFSVQQFLHTLCKANVGALGKRAGVWSFGEGAPEGVRLSSRLDIVQILDFAEKLGIIEAVSAGGDSGDQQSDVFTAYKLTEKYWEKFDKFVI